MVGHSYEQGGAAERWNQIYDVFTAEPRRMIIYSLMNEPEGRRLPLPEAAVPQHKSVDTESFRVQLRHQHLPKLADAGYVRWEADPLCVQRGPNFDEAATILKRVTEPVDGLPESLIADCRVLQQSPDDS